MGIALNTEKNKERPDSLNLKESIRDVIKYTLDKDPYYPDKKDLFYAVALIARRALIKIRDATELRYKTHSAKRVYYLSMEYLIGRLLENNLINLGMIEDCKEALSEMGITISDVYEGEHDAALGNGGLGRLAACFLDSLATLGMPGFGYGINYKFGLFKQEIENGHQKILPDNWLSEKSPWLIAHPEESCEVPLYGRVEETHAPFGAQKTWKDFQIVIGVPHDLLIAGYGARTVNTLRLFSAQASKEFDIELFSQGGYMKAVEEKIKSEKISQILYPPDNDEMGKELRLVQEYFLVACALRDIIKKYTAQYGRSFDRFPTKIAIQLNDTHPSLAIVELMRILIDEERMEWDKALDISTRTFGYTNHTLLSEALEKWQVPLLERVLPRHLQIIYEINHQFLQKVLQKWPGDVTRMREMSIIEEGDPKHVRMAYLSIVGSHSVNGVAKLHSELIRTEMVPYFYELWPEKFNNKTNGITQRRWLLKANPALANRITKLIGDKWITDLTHLRLLEPYADDRDFQKDIINIKYANKQNLAKIIKKTTHTVVNPESFFDVLAKRSHEYKRQLLKVMQIIHAYFEITQDGKELPQPQTYIFAGKAAPGYWAARQIIKLIHNVAGVINTDPRTQDQMKIVFIPDYRVSLAEAIIPAADISEHISTAGKEASGTSNMKFALNGALIIGTFDGANIEIAEEVGEENIYLFGTRASEIKHMQTTGAYNPKGYYYKSPDLRRVIDSFKSDIFCRNEPGIFEWIYNMLLHSDFYFHIADFESYCETFERAARDFNNPARWAKKTILNISRIGKFSSDRSIEEYAREIWGIEKIL